MAGLLFAWRRCAPLALAFALFVPFAARADLNVGVILSLTGPGASLGLPAQNAVQLMPQTLAGEKLNVTVLNDATDVTQASRAATKLITENNVDIIIGSSLTPPSLAVIEVAAQHGTPVISLAGGSAIVLPQTGPRKWAFKVSPPERITVELVLGHMKRNGLTTVGAIALSTAYGDGYLQLLQQLTPQYGVKIAGVERYNQTDQSVTAQMSKLTQSKPDAIFVISAGTPGALPQIELNKQGYKGLVYQTQGVANNDFLRVGGKDVDGAYIAISPLMVAAQLEAANPIRPRALEFIKLYEGKHGAGTANLFAATVWDATLILEHALPQALKAAKPGTPEFRKALRDAMENSKEVATPSAVYNFSAEDHNGADARSQVLARIEQGKWVYIKP